jgi:hypothetical protein
VAEALARERLEVRRSVGLSDFTVDLAVRAPGRPWIAVMLDGPAWRRRRTVGDRDGLPPTVLMGAMRWAAVKRIWLPTWVADAERVVKDILHAAESAEEAQIEDPPPSLELSDTAVEDFPALRGSFGDETQPAPTTFETHAPLTDEPRPTLRPDPIVLADDRPVQNKWVLEHLEYADNKREVQAAMRDVVAVEGPMLSDRLARVVARRFGMERIRGERIADILKVAPRGLLHKSPNGDVVAWPDGTDPRSFTGFRMPEDGSKRPVDDVPYPELVNAMVAHALASHGLRQDDLLRATARTFGTTQLGKKVRERLEPVLDAAVRSGDLAYDGDHVIAGTRP